MLGYYVSHVPSWTEVWDHIEVVEGLECVVQFYYKSIINLSLNFLLSNDKPRQTIVSPLLHSLHGEEIITVDLLN